MNISFRTVPWIESGLGKISNLPDVCRKLKIKRPIIITDKGLFKLGYIEKINKSLKKNNIQSCVFKDVLADPPEYNIFDALKVFETFEADGVIGFGGGSPIDTAKAISAMSKFSKNIQDYKPPSLFNKKGLPIIAIPTTAGTGSEVTHHSVVIDSKNNEKISCRGEGFVPIV